MKVLKFGGTSVANAENISKVKEIVCSLNNNQQIIVVVSALGGVTDLLLEASRRASLKDETYLELVNEIETRHFSTIKSLIKVQDQSEVLSKIKAELNTLETLLEGSFLIGEQTPKLSDKVVSYGELLSSYIIATYFKAEKLDAQHLDSRTVIKTNEQFNKAIVNFEVTNENLMTYVKNNTHRITVMGGFIASSLNGESTTLGRGGSDYTAAIVAAAINANELEIYTDVSGMFTANPKMVKQAKPIENISYEEAMELSHFGAKVLYPPTIQPVLNKEIPIVIKNTFKPDDKGTTIAKNNSPEHKSVQGISHIDSIALLSLEGPGMVGVAGISKRFFEVLSNAGISVVMITQASSEHSICIGVNQNDAYTAAELINEAFEFEISKGKIKTVVPEIDYSIVALVGDNMKSHQGLSGKMFSTLGKNNVNIVAIAQGASEKNISVVIKSIDVKKALNTLHETFFEENVKQLNLFVMGVGNVGSRFIAQLNQQKNYLKKHLKLNIRIIGISNSRTMVFKESGIDLTKWEELLASGEKADKVVFLKQVQLLNYRNSIFVDNTASAEVAATYEAYLSKSISVVTCNKIACSSDYSRYKNLKFLASEYNAPFLFETNVGAGLPIIDTLKNLVASGDKIMKIQAVLSGSLNFVFNTFNDQTQFATVVKQAQSEGYTEPDPTIDLSGIDVMRKILILARESGNQLELNDIENRSFLPQACLETNSNEAFFESLQTYEDHFQSLYKSASEKSAKLKYVATFDQGKARVGLEEIPQGHDFYNLEGSDNIVLFYTERYPNQPMIIKGAGAGADVTASGIFADIIRIGNY